MILWARARAGIAAPALAAGTALMVWPSLGETPPATPDATRVTQAVAITAQQDGTTRVGQAQALGLQQDGTTRVSQFVGVGAQQDGTTRVTQMFAVLILDLSNPPGPGSVTCPLDMDPGAASGSGCAPDLGVE